MGAVLAFEPLYLHLVNRAVENCLFFGRLKKIEIDIVLSSG
jgi:hypothetical protein